MSEEEYVDDDPEYEADADDDGVLVEERSARSGRRRLGFEAGDTVNGLDWSAGYTGTRLQNGKQVRSAEKLRQGDCVVYGTEWPGVHVAIVVGARTVSRWSSAMAVKRGRSTSVTTIGPTSFGSGATSRPPNDV
jgi:hypothetical protein